MWSILRAPSVFFHGDASKASVLTRKRLAEQITKLDQEIEAYGKSLEDNYAAEAKEPGKDRLDGPGEGGRGNGGDIGAKVAALMAKRSRAQADLDRLEANGETQLSLTDRDARLLVKNGQGVAGYNVQTAVDDKHQLIVASEVVNDSSDVGQLHAMAKAAKDALGAEVLQRRQWKGLLQQAPNREVCERMTASARPCAAAGGERQGWEQGPRPSRTISVTTRPPMFTVVRPANGCVR